MTSPLTFEQLESLPAYVPVLADVRNGTQIVAQKSPNGIWWSTWKNPVDLPGLWSMVTLNGGTFVALPVLSVVETAERLAKLPLGTIVVNRHGDVGIITASDTSTWGPTCVTYTADVEDQRRAIHDIVAALDGPWVTVPRPPAGTA
jgi:hypothetical protein